MTVEATSPIVRYVYTGPGDYTFLFRIFEDTDLKATHVSTLGVSTELINPSDFTVDVDGDDGGTVTTTFSETTGTLELRREVPLTQVIDFENQGPLPMDLIEDGLDRTTMVVQQMDSLVREGSASSTWRGDWITGAEYDVKDIVKGPDLNWYGVIEEHTAGVFATDLAAGYFILVLDVVGILNDAQDLMESVADDIAAVGERSDAINTDKYTATAGQTIFTITKPSGEENIFVFLNTRKLRLTEDYTLNSTMAASELTLGTGAAAGDELDIVSFNTYGLTGLSVPTLEALRLAGTLLSTLFLEGRASSGDGAGGTFIWSDSNLSSKVAADPLSGIYVAPDSDSTGASGAWVRQYATAIDVRWFGALGDASNDDTTAIQGAIDLIGFLNSAIVTIAVNQATYPVPVLRIPKGSYKFSTLTISSQIVLAGDGMYNTILRTTSASDDAIVVTSEHRVELMDLSLGAYDGVVRTAGAFLTIYPSTNSNQLSTISRVGFHNAFIAIHLKGAAFARIDGCYFNASTNVAIIVENTLSSDIGDSTIESNIFNNGTGISIQHLSSGGLRIINNKFLGGIFHYLSDFNTYPTHTGQLIIQGNSFDQAAGACIGFDSSSSPVTPFSLVLISGNVFCISDAAYGIYVQDRSPFLYGVDISDNLLYYRGSGTGLYISGGVVNALVGQNKHTADGGTTVAVQFTAGVGLVTVHPQTLINVDTMFVGLVANVSVIPGLHVLYSGDPNSHIIPNYIGEVCLDTLNTKWYKSHGLLNSQWSILN